LLANKNDELVKTLNKEFMEHKKCQLPNHLFLKVSVVLGVIYVKFAIMEFFIVCIPSDRG